MYDPYKSPSAASSEAPPTGSSTSQPLYETPGSSDAPGMSGSGTASKKPRKHGLSPRRKLHLIAGALLLAAVLGLGLFISRQIAQNRDGSATITLTATLKEIINKSELSTFSAVYNGIAEVRSEKDPEKIDYYTSYQGRINAGIDFDQIQIQADPETRTLAVTLPPTRILEPTVDIGSLDFIFLNDRANQSEVSSQAYSACLEDITRESQEQEAIIDLAEQNAENVIRALAQPLLDGFYPDYTLEFTKEAAEQ